MAVVWLAFIDTTVSGILNKDEKEFEDPEVYR